MSRGSLAVLALLALVPAPALAQRPIELGLDLGMAVSLDDPRVLQVSLPLPEVRAGFPVSDKVSLEPRLGATIVDVADFGSAVSLNTELGAVFHLEMLRRGPYLRPFAGLFYLDGSDTDGVSQFALGGGVGYKVPAGDRILARFEVLYQHGFESDDVGSNDQVGLLIGISFLTR